MRLAPASSFAAWLATCLLPALAPAQDPPAAVFSIRASPAGDLLSVWMRNTVPVRAGSFCLVIDPDILAVREISMGAMFSLLPADVVNITDDSIFDERGDAIAGGHLFVWINSLQNITQSVLVPGEYETYRLRVDPAGGQPVGGECAIVKFLEAASSAPNAIPVHNEVAEDGLTDYRAITEGKQVCPGAPGEGGLQMPGDCTQDGVLDISDAVCMLVLFFRGELGILPCGGNRADGGGNKDLLDFNGDEELDVSDVVALLMNQFNGGAAHILGIQCTRLFSCPDACRT